MYDLIVVGARCAGATLVSFLARQGYKILLIDKYKSPGPTVSTHIVGEIDVYERLGINEKMESSGAPLLTRMRVGLEDSILESEMIVTSRAIGIRREILDKLLFEEATKYSNVDVLLETKVTGTLSSEGSVVGVKCLLPNGEIKEYYSKVVVGADGRSSVIANSVNAEIIDTVDNNHLSVFYSYVDNIQHLPIPAVEWYWRENGIVICNPIDNNKHCIAIMIDQKTSKKWNEDKRYFFEEYLKHIKPLSSRFEKDLSFERIKGIGSIPSYIKHCYGEGWVLVGDASSYLHPVSGVGIDNAVCLGEQLAKELNMFLEGKQTWDKAMSTYKNVRDERIFPQYQMLQSTLQLATETISAEDKDTMKMLFSFPSLSKKIAMNSNGILSLF
ncbi:NAD(P)/FAD-dependent oxidoreductase [Cytobacillus praedii]|uniref:NAD(P)/FAD-dependent oxidoreductase n=1 Tax=Cytobacillus praedii TaxID=1742358 RepID=UPI003F800FE4